MPDLKFWSAERARRYSRRADYPEVARRNIAEMHRQVGPLRLDERGLAVRGVLLRHLVMPGMLDETEAILRWIADELGGDTYVNLMAQYYPAGLVTRGDDHAEIDRHVARDEFASAVRLATSLGLRLDERSIASGLALARP